MPIEIHSIYREVKRKRERESEYALYVCLYVCVCVCVSSCAFIVCGVSACVGREEVKEKGGC